MADYELICKNESWFSPISFSLVDYLAFASVLHIT